MVPKLKAFKLINNERGISLTTEGIVRLKGPQGSCSPPRCPSTEGEVVRTDPNIRKKNGTQAFAAKWTQLEDIAVGEK